MPLLPPDPTRLTGRLTDFLHAGKEILFPARCLHCARQLPCWGLPLFCADCLAEIVFLNSPLCIRCGVPFPGGSDHICGQCLAGANTFHSARSALLYREPAAGLISSLKFNRDVTGLSTLAMLAAASAGFAMLSQPDLILPVPLHKNRLRKRGFNQALQIARAIFPGYRREIKPSLLVRNRPTTPQTGLSGIQRRRNLSRAFSVKQPEMVKGRKILLIDDVFTTGSTVNECARTLYRNGAGKVEVFTVARAL